MGIKPGSMSTPVCTSGLMRRWLMCHAAQLTCIRTIFGDIKNENKCQIKKDVPSKQSHCKAFIALPINRPCGALDTTVVRRGGSTLMWCDDNSQTRQTMRGAMYDHQHCEQLALLHAIRYGGMAAAWFANWMTDWLAALYLCANACAYILHFVSQSPWMPKMTIALKVDDGGDPVLFAIFSVIFFCFCFLCSCGGGGRCWLYLALRYCWWHLCDCMISYVWSISGCGICAYFTAFVWSSLFIVALVKRIKR